MSEDQSAVARVAPVLVGVDGVVKWFDPRKGFGFVAGPEGQDIFIHFSVIEQPDGFRTLRDGERIVYSAACGAKGWAATHVRAVASRTGSDPTGKDAGVSRNPSTSSNGKAR